MKQSKAKVATAPEDAAIHKAVQKAYGDRAAGRTGGCCSAKTEACCAAPSANVSRAAENMGYSSDDVANAPDDSNLGLGCGAPLKAAKVSAGDVVLDLGSGAGFDAFLAARAVGEGGYVIGVDMTPEMIEKARKNAAKRTGRDQAPVDFREGKIELLPLESASVDVVISNCVINLSPDKRLAFREAFRVLKSGGRIALSDIVLTKPLPLAVQRNLAAYVGCVAGASLLPDYLDALKSVGFEGVTATTRRAFDVLACDDPVVLAAIKGIEHEEGVNLEELKNSIVSATVIGYKPSVSYCESTGNEKNV